MPTIEPCRHCGSSRAYKHTNRGWWTQSDTYFCGDCNRMLDADYSAEKWGRLVFIGLLVAAVIAGVVFIINDQNESKAARDKAVTAYENCLASNADQIDQICIHP